MAQTNDFSIDANLQGLEFRTQANEKLLALATLNAGNTPPANPQNCMLWFDTANSVLKIRKSSSWVTIGSLGEDFKAADSDKLDGFDSSAFSKSDHNHDGIYLTTSSLGERNLNDITAPGSYGQHHLSNGTRARNYPKEKCAGSLLVQPSAHGATQTFVQYNTDNVYIRNTTSSNPVSWSEWKQLAAISDLPSSATENKAGVVKIKNSFTGNAQDATLTEKAIGEKIAQISAQIFGANQTWQDVTSQRSIGVTYTNSTGKPIQVCIIGEFIGTPTVRLKVNNTQIDCIQTTHAFDFSLSGIVPNNATYRTETEGGTSFTLKSWVELR